MTLPDQPKPSSHSAPRVLVVDDDDSIRSLIATVLERADYLVGTAQNGREALEALRSDDDRFSVVVLDLMMPESSGFEVINALRDDVPEGLKGLVVVSAIGRPLRETDRDLVCAVVSKPFDLEQLTAAVERCLITDAARPRVVDPERSGSRRSTDLEED